MEERAYIMQHNLSLSFHFIIFNVSSYCWRSHDAPRPFIFSLPPFTQFRLHHRCWKDSLTCIRPIDRRDDHSRSSTSASNFLLITSVNQHLSGPLRPTANLCVLISLSTNGENKCSAALVCLVHSRWKWLPHNLLILKKSWLRADMLTW